jgi:hypothetical protein
MKISKVIEWLQEMNPEDVIGVAWYEKDHMEDLLDRKLSDEEWDWLADDIGNTLSLTDWDVERYGEDLVEEFGKSE